MNSLLKLIKPIFLFISIIFYYGCSSKSESSEYKLFYDDIHDNVRIGDSRDKVVMYLSEKKIEYIYDSLRDRYEYEFKGKDVSLWQTHIIAMIIDIKSGHVEDIKITEFYRTL